MMSVNSFLPPKTGQAQALRFGTDSIQSARIRMREEDRRQQAEDQRRIATGGAYWYEALPELTLEEQAEKQRLEPIILRILTERLSALGERRQVPF